jgi:3-keto-5-aminohexanoate cleavage enzyme
MDSYVLNACLTGMVPTKEQTPHVPVSPDEIVEDALTCAAAGASIAHVHARDATGRPTPDKEVYREIVDGLRSRSDVVVCVSTSGRDWPELERRSAALELEPDMASLTLGSMNFPRQASVNSPDTIKALARKMLEHGVKPELEVFEAGMVDFAHHLIAKGHLEPPFYFNLLLGSLGTMEADASNLVHLVSRLPEGSYWAVAGVGSRQFSANCLGLAMGGGVRVGLEDNIWMDEARAELATNPALVERIAGVGAEMQRRPLEAREVRQLLELRRMPQVEAFAPTPERV